jgi:uncharacterized membrane protein
MIDLLAAAIVFILFHLLVSGTRVRDVIVARVGAGPFTGLFSVGSIAGLVWLGFAYAHARGAAGDATFWTVTPATRWVQIVIQIVAFQFIVIGLTTPNPTSVAQEGALDRPNVVGGMLRITRHPFLWGVAIWAAGHLLVNGDVASLVLFGSLLILALFGTVSIDAKRKRMLGERWTAFASKTSNPPFAAILGGRQTLKLGELGWWRPLLAFVIYIALLFGHPYIFGASALPTP